MNGTSFSVTAAMRLMPPSTTSAATAIRQTPVTQAGMWKASVMFTAMELI